MRVPNAECNVEFIVSILCSSLISGEATKKTVRTYSTINGITDVASGNRGSVVKGVRIVDGKHPAGRSVVAFPRGADIREHFKIIVYFHQILVDERADQLIGVIGRNQRIKTVAAVNIQGKHAVCCSSHGQIFPFGRLGDFIG